MPYIDPHTRLDLDPHIDELAQLVMSDGELNYCITRLLLHQWEANPRYSTLNSLVGVLECVKLELYRQYGVPYEDIKRKENGPVQL